jgi:hypothetical protein
MNTLKEVWKELTDFSRSPVYACVRAIRTYFKKREIENRIKSLPSTPFLLKVLARNKNEYFRSKAALALKWKMDAEAIPPLVEALTDKSPMVRKWADNSLMALGPRNTADLNALALIGRKLKKEGRDIKAIAELHGKWSNALSQRAKNAVNDKNFHIPRIREPDKAERILRVRRAGA